MTTKPRAVRAQSPQSVCDGDTRLGGLNQDTNDAGLCQPAIDPLDWTLPIFVISLPEACARRRRMRKQLLSSPHTFEIVDAVRAGAMDGAMSFERIDARRFYLQVGRRVRAEEVGCFASHRLLWQRCIDLNEPVVILEDDAKLSADFDAGLELVNGWIAALGFIRLQVNPKSGGRSAASSGQHTLRFNHRYPFGSMAYAISPSVAQRFVAASTTFYAPVDKFIKNFWEHGQPLHSIYPGIVVQGSWGNTSTIGRRPRARASFSQRAVRLLFRAVQYLGRSVYVWRYRWRFAGSIQHSDR